MNKSSLGFERPKIPVVGKADGSRKEGVESEIRNNFSDNRAQINAEGRRKLAAVEYPKSNIEQAIIGDINHLLNEKLTESGVDSFDIPLDNIYLVPNKTYRELGGDDSDELGDAYTEHRRQSIVIDAESSPSLLERASVLSHEMTHLKNFLSVETSGDDDVSLRRIGLQINSSQKRDESIGRYTALSGLNEAVVSQLEKEIFKSLLQKNTKLQEEYDQMFSTVEGQAKRSKLAEKFNLSEDDIHWVSEDAESGRSVSYVEQRKVLDYILATIVEKLPEQFPDKDAAFKLFVNAHFSGKMLPMARVIRSVFGDDALRVISMMDAHDKNSTRLVMNYLQKKGGRKTIPTEPIP